MITRWNSFASTFKMETLGESVALSKWQNETPPVCNRVQFKFARQAIILWQRNILSKDSYCCNSKYTLHFTWRHNKLSFKICKTGKLLHKHIFSHNGNSLLKDRQDYKKVVSTYPLPRAPSLPAHSPTTTPATSNRPPLPLTGLLAVKNTTITIVNTVQPDISFNS